MYQRRLVFIAACLGMLTFGIVLSTLGAVLPSLVAKFEISKTSAGGLMLLLSIGILLGSLVQGPIVDRFGYKKLFIVCAGLIFVGMEGLAFAGDWRWLQIAAFFVGLGGGFINGSANALVADISESGKSANLSILGIFFGLGAVGVPFLLGNLLTFFTFEKLIGSLGGLVLLTLLFFCGLKFPAPKQPQGFPLKSGLGLLNEWPLLLFGLILFFESGLEITVGNWTALFLKEELFISADQAVLYLSFFWLGIILTRMVLGKLLTQTNPATVQFASFGIALFGALILLLSNRLWLSNAGLFLIGCGFAATFPVILGYVGERYASLSGTAFSIVLVMALTGGSFFPWLIGRISENFGLRLSFFVVPIAISAMTGIFFVIRQRFLK